jgi:CTP:molybdopterin cytidylyltransferase MocA
MSLGVGAPTVIVLAAGGSSRFGRDKLLVDLGGKPMLERTVACYAKATKVGDVLVVVGPGQKQAWQWLAGLRVHVVENPDPTKGMISTIRAGLQSAWAKDKDFLVTPADVPFVKPEIVDRIVVDFRSRTCKVLIPVYRGLGGHPGMYSASVQRDFFLHGERQGTREILLRHRDETVRLAVHDPDVCFDVDTESDAASAMDPGARWARVEAEVEARSRH